MGRLFKNELLKIKYNKTIWVFWGVSATFVAIMATMEDGYGIPLNWYGYTCSFAYMRMAGTISVMFLSPIVGTLFTKELQEGTMHNTLSCGVSRGQYFFAKAVCAFVIDLLIFLFCVAEHVCLRTVVVGWLPPPERVVISYPDYGLANLVYHSGVCLLVCVYIALYILVAVSVKKPAVVYLSGAVATLGELSLEIYLPPSYKGVMPAIQDMYELAQVRRILTPEFAGLLWQGALMGVVFFALAFLIFRKRDMN